MSIMRQRLVELIAGHLGVPTARVDAVHNLTELEIDSLGLIDLITFVETAIGIRIPNETLDGLATLDDFVVAVQGCLEYENS
jgi:acyl carrier protein